MHPNAFLKTLWRSEILDQVFVAMSFEDRFLDRYEKIIRPAIEAELIEGYSLKAYRVDNSKTGDSILSEIINGIVHSRLVLADVSVIDRGHFIEAPIRNGNVMYEVGVALACRQPSEVLLIRDDKEKFLFDISTIPHTHIDFDNAEEAKNHLRAGLRDRIKESNLINDFRTLKNARSLTTVELNILRHLAELPEGYSSSFVKNGQMSLPIGRGLETLIQKDCLQAIAQERDSKEIFYKLTKFGRALFDYAETRLPKISAEKTEKT